MSPEGSISPQHQDAQQLFAAAGCCPGSYQLFAAHRAPQRRRGQTRIGGGKQARLRGPGSPSRGGLRVSGAGQDSGGQRGNLSGQASLGGCLLLSGWPEGGRCCPRPGRGWAGCPGRTMLAPREDAGPGPALPAPSPGGATPAQLGHTRLEPPRSRSTASPLSPRCSATPSTEVLSIWCVRRWPPGSERRRGTGAPSHG